MNQMYKPSNLLLGWKRTMTFIMSFVFLLSSLSQLQAQTTVQIGTNGASSDYFYGPIYRSSGTSSFHFSRYAYVYTAAELAAQGINAGDVINDVKFFRNSTSQLSGTSTATLNVYVNNTTNTAMTSGIAWTTLIAGATLAHTSTYNATTNLFPASTGWMTFAFTSPYTYTGGSLEIYTDWVLTPGTSPFTTGSLTWLYASGYSTTTAIGIASGTAAGVATLSTTYGGTLRPNTQLTYTAGSACSGQPTPGATQGPSSVCPGQSFTLSNQNPTLGSGVTFQWESADDAAFTLGVTTLGTTPSQSTSQTTDKYYRCLVTCTNSGLSDYSTPLFVAVNSFLNCYCSSGATNNFDEEIYNVTIGSGSTDPLYANANGCATPAPGPGSALGLYSNFKTLAPITTVAQGDIVPFSIYQDECDGATYYNNGIAMWIDYDQNGIYDASEQVYVENVTSVGPRTATGNFSVPFTAALGTTTVRIVCAEGFSGAGLTPCLSYGYGETEDYLIDIVASTNCSGLPTPGNTIASASSVCPGANVNLSLQNQTIGSGVTYQWESADDPAFTLNVTSFGTNSPFQTINPTTDQYYRCLVTCTNSGLSDYSAGVQVTINSFINCYCSSGATVNADEEIYNVTIGSGSTDPLYANANGCSTPAPGPGSVLGGYSNFKTLAPITSVGQGDVVPFSIDQDECDGATYYNNGIAMWIDFDQNGVYDAAEQVYVENATSTGPRTASGSFTVPISALVGTTTVRIVCADGFSGTGLTPCLSYGYGETEDYLIDITAAVPCAGQPTPGNTLATASSYCLPANPITLSMQNNTTGLGVSYQWEEADDPAFIINQAFLGTNPTQVITPTGGDKYYRCLVSCAASGLSDYSTPILISQNAITSCYCTPSYTNGTIDGDLISQVEISGTTLLNNSGTTTGTPSWVEYIPPTYTAANFTANMNAGNTYNVNVTIGSFSNQGVAVWIDFNDNGIFDATEKIGSTSGTILTSFGVGSFPITLPCNPPIGTHRMRVRCAYATSGGTIDPCANYGWGETEDYLVTVDPALPCPAPSAFTPSNITQTSVDLTWVVGCVETAWNIDYGAVGHTAGTGTIVPVTGTPSTTLALPNCETSYDIFIQADCSAASPDSSLWVGPITVTTALCPCVTPAPGNTLASAASVCSFDNLVLTLQNATGGAGVTYQWYESTDGITYTAAASTSDSYTLNQSVPMWYYCDVTCSTGPTTVSSTPVMVGMNPGLQCYCPSGATVNADEEIYNVTVNGASTDPLYAGVNGCSTVAPGPNSVLGGYSNFTTLGALTTLPQGGSVAFQVDEDECDGATYYACGIAIWIDFNQDGDFDDAGEEVYMENTTTAGPRSATGTINIPATATLGLTRMRVTASEGNAGTGVLTPCLSYGYGETEDYLVNIVSSGATLNLTAFIQGYYAGGNSQQAVLVNQGISTNPTDCDDITVELHDATPPYATVATFTGVLQTNGTVSCTFPGTVIGNSYYIVLIHRNSVQTWSAAPVLMSATTSYNFSTSAAQAYGNNEVDAIADGTYSMYNGDVNQDGFIDIFDFLDWDIDNQNFVSGYFAIDFNGDGFVDIFDFLVWDPNNQNFIGLLTP